MKTMRLLVFIIFTVTSLNSVAGIKPNQPVPVTSIVNLNEYVYRQSMAKEKPPTTAKYFNRNAQYIRPRVLPYSDIPMTYNHKVRKWLAYFQKDGRKWFQKWLERSHRYIPQMQIILASKGLPRDLAYIPMIESGFSPHAKSFAKAVGYWQFIEPTANRYGLKTNWWLDERRDYRKSTEAAANYLADLYRLLGSWYLVAAGYNAGENRVIRATNRHKTTDFWRLAELRALPDETTNYVPKLIAAMLIAKDPANYGFVNVNPVEPLDYEIFYVPGGTDLEGLARHLNIKKKEIETLNPELLHGFVPATVNGHRIRIPKGSIRKVAEFIRRQNRVN